MEVVLRDLKEITLIGSCDLGFGTLGDRYSHRREQVTLFPSGNTTQCCFNNGVSPIDVIPVNSIGF